MMSNVPLYCFLLVGILAVAIIVASSNFVILQSSFMPIQSSAFATSLGENGKIVFHRGGGPLSEIFVMNADGTGRDKRT